MKRLHIDTETFSPVPLGQGVHKYATKVEVMVVTWAMNFDAVQTWDATPAATVKGVPITFDPPIALRRALIEADEIWAHGAEFDRTVLETCEWYRKLAIPASKWRCSQHLARSAGLPAGLLKLCEIFNIDAASAKDEGGKALIQVFCKPQQDGSRHTKHTRPKQWAEFLSYAAQDIVAMRVVMSKIPWWNWTDFELAVMALDAKMNDRGLRMDLELAEAAVKCTTRAKARLARQTEHLTAGEVERTTQRDKLLKFILAAYDIELPDLTMDTVERRLNDPEIPEPVKELLRNRQEASKASTGKYKRILSSAVGDRLYGLLTYCGASRTGRWAGRIFQPHNLPRPRHSLAEIEIAIDAFKLDDPELVFDDIMGMGASMLRSTPIAAEGRKLVVSDLSNIEGRALAWMAGEDWKLRAFDLYDKGLGFDLYILSYANSFRMDPANVTKPQRQIGKVQELALQYYGGVGAFISMSEVYNIDLDAMAEAAWPTLRAEDIAQARRDYVKAGKRNRHFGLAEKTWLVCQVFVLGWRRAHPAIMQWHKDIENAVIEAISSPNRSFRVRAFTVDRRGNWLRIRSPSGSYLLYPGIRYDEAKRQISYMGVNQYTKQWGRLKTYSGKISQNLTERVARDVLAAGMLDAENEGWNPLLTVHDELITEPEDLPAFTPEGLSAILTADDPWHAGLPLEAKGFEAYRYRKDE